MTPPELPADDGQPITPPRTVVIATVLAILGGAGVLHRRRLAGHHGLPARRRGRRLQPAARRLPRRVPGVGAAVVVPPDSAAQDVKDRAANCQRYEPLTDEIISTARTQNIVISGAIIVIGLVAAVGGWFLRSGTGWRGSW